MNDFSTKATSHSEAYIVENGDILCDLNKTILNSSQRKISNIRFIKVVIQNNDGKGVLSVPFSLLFYDRFFL